jgi:hypothetical protein
MLHGHFNYFQNHLLEVSLTQNWIYLFSEYFKVTKFTVGAFTKSFTHSRGDLSIKERAFHFERFIGLRRTNDKGPMKIHVLDGRLTQLVFYPDN